MVLKTICIDDEVLARKTIERFCEKSNHVELIDSFEDAASGLKYLQDNEIDLIFLDIEMPKMTGIEMLDQLMDIPQVIFTTSKKEYAYEAIEYEVTDFLKKPVEALRFEKAVSRAVENEERTKATALSSARTEIYLRVDGKLIRIPYDNILYFENVGDYIKIITEDKTHVFHGALKTIAARLNHPRLLKVHRSFIVNLDKVRDVQDNSIVIHKKVIPISRAHKPILIKSLNILN